MTRDHGPRRTGIWRSIWVGPDAACARQSEKLGFRIGSINDLLDHEQDRCRIRDLLALGLKHLLDPYQQIEQLLLVSVLAEQLPEHAEIFATRPYFLVSYALGLMDPGTSTVIRLPSS